MHTQVFSLIVALIVAAASPALADDARARDAERLRELPTQNREAVLDLLAETRRLHGETAVIVQTQLLLNALRSGAQLAVGVRVKDVDEHEGRSYLRFDVDSGYIFDDRTRDATARVHVVWQTLIAPSLKTTEKSDLKQDGLSFVVEAHHRPYESAAALKKTIDDHGTAETMTFLVAGDALARLTSGKIDDRELFEQTIIRVDGETRTLPPPPAGKTGTLGPA